MSSRLRDAAIRPLTGKQTTELARACALAGMGDGDALELGASLIRVGLVTPAALKYGPNDDLTEHTAPERFALKVTVQAMT